MPMRIADLTEADQEFPPKWFQDGRVIPDITAVERDASEILSDEEQRLEWRLCRVPVNFIRPSGACETDEQRQERMDFIDRLAERYGREGAFRHHPPLLLLNPTEPPELADGHHRWFKAMTWALPWVWAAVAIENVDQTSRI